MDTSMRQILKAKAHALKPVVIIGAKGLSSAVIEETNQALIAHELIKVKIHGLDKADKRKTAQELCQQLQAEFIQLIGNTVIIYRKNTEKE